MLEATSLSHIPLLLDSLIALLIFLVSGAFGVGVMRGIRLNGISRMERGLFAFALGLGVVSYLPFVLFALHLGKPVFLVSVFLVLSLICAKDQLRIVQYLIGQIRKVSELPAPTKIFLVFFLPLLLVTFVQALCPPTDPDGLHYHLTAPQFYLREGGFFYAPSYLHMNWPLGIEMLFALGMAFHTHFAAGIVQFGIGLVLLLTVYQLCLRLVPSDKDNAASAIVGSAAVALSFPFIRGEMTWAYIDLGMGLYITVAGYALHLAWQGILGGENKKQIALYWTLAALFAGLSTTAKLPGLFVLVLVALIIGGQSRSLEKTGSLIAALRFMVFTFAVGFLVAAPWFLRCWIQSRDPIYPYFGGLFGALDWSPAYQKRLNEYFQMFNTLRTRHLTDAQVVQVRAVSCLVIAALGAIACGLPKSRPMRSLIFYVFALTFLQIATSGIYVRYFLPFMPLMFAVALARMGRLFAIKPLGSAILGLACLWLWGLWKFPTAIRGEIGAFAESAKVAIGMTSRESYLAEKLSGFATAEWCNHNLPTESVIVLGLYDAHAALYDRRTLITQYWTQNAVRFDSPEILRSDLKRLGATHLIINETPPDNLSAALRDKESRLRGEIEMPMLTEICRRNGTRVHQDNGYTVYALHLP